MVSNLKSETARANGAKSRGPTTDEGKEKSSRNAIKHGLTAGNGNILLDCEDPDQFDEVLNKLLGIHEPATPAETDLVEEMFACRLAHPPHVDHRNRLAQRRNLRSGSQDRYPRPQHSLG